MTRLSLDRHLHFANLFYAFRRNDISRYQKELEICKKWLDEDLYNILFNLAISSAFTRKGYFEK